MVVGEGDTAPEVASGGGRDALRNYVDSVLARLDKSPGMNPTELREKVMPSVVSSIQRMVSSAPAETKGTIKGALEATSVLPTYDADMEGFKGALRKIREIIAGAGPDDRQAVTTPAEPPSDKGPEDQAQHKHKLIQRQPTYGHHLRGISVHFLSTTFLDEIKSAGLERTAKVYEIEPLLIRPKGDGVQCPRDHRPGAAYVDCLDEGDAGIATHMLSYTWGYEIGSIVDSLVAFCKTNKLDPNETFFWICCLCINQHRVKEAQAKKEVVPFEAFKGEFGQRVSCTGHIVAMMAPWHDPFYTKRVWCDFEMYTAASMGDKCKISVVMPPAEAADMRKALTSGPINNPKMWEALQNVKIELAEASVKEDKDRILNLIDTTTGFHTLNAVVASCLRDWISSTCEDIFANIDAEMGSQQDAAKTCARMGYILRDLSKTQQALVMVNRAVELFKTSGLTDSLDWACLMSNLGSLKRHTDLDGSLEILKRSEKIYKRINQENTPEFAMLYNTLGAAQRQKRLLGDALTSFDRGLEILNEIGQADSQEAASMNLSMGATQKDLDDYTGALEAFDRAKQILERTNNTGIPLMGFIMNSIGSTKKVQKDWNGALEAYNYAKDNTERLGNGESENAAGLWLNIGHSKKGLKDFDGAKEAYEKAQLICEKLGKMDENIGQRVKDALGKGKGKGGGKGNEKHGGGGKGNEKHGGGGCGGGGYVSRGGGDSHASGGGGSKGQGPRDKGGGKGDRYAHGRKGDHGF